VTKKTSWESPGDAVMMLPTKGGAPLSTLVPVDRRRIWKRKTQKKSGRVYYVNTETRKTSWRNPGDDVLIIPRTRAAAAGGGGGGVSGAARIWKVKVAKTGKKLGKTYYVNTLTKVTTWTNPGDDVLIVKGAAALVDPAAAEAERIAAVARAAASAAAVEEALTAAAEAATALADAVAAASAAQAAADAAARRVWIERIQEGSQKRFYLNIKTNEWTWTRPPHQVLLPSHYRANARTGAWENAPVGEAAEKQEAEEAAARARVKAHFEHAAQRKREHDRRKEEALYAYVGDADDVDDADSDDPPPPPPDDLYDGPSLALIDGAQPPPPFGANDDDLAEGYGHYYSDDGESDASDDPPPPPPPPPAGWSDGMHGGPPPAREDVARSGASLFTSSITIG
jgi:hypothetical protein